MKDNLMPSAGDVSQRDLGIDLLTRMVSHYTRRAKSSEDPEFIRSVGEAATLLHYCYMAVAGIKSTETVH